MTILLSYLILLFSGCSSSTYPGDHLKEALSKICREEYKIKYVDVKITDTTIGVYLPVKKLFAADFKEAMVSGKVRNLESLLEPHPEALEKVEDVLLSMSRVLLSTDRKIEFYILQAADVEKTGMQLVLSGNVDDIRRLRAWDISRDEYRKRIVHELKPNRAARWHQPVRQFFEDLNRLSLREIHKIYFGESLPAQTIRSLFFNLLPVSPDAKSGVIWNVIEMKSVPVQKNQILVYTKIKPEGTVLPPGYPQEFQYLFLMGITEDSVRILRIIPFQYLDAQHQFHKVPFPKELAIEENLEKWDEEFQIQPINLGQFLAEQLTRRAQALIGADERINNTFREIKLDFQYDQTLKPARFALNIGATLTDFNNYSHESIVFHEDMSYLLNLVTRELVNLLRNYRFDKYDFLRLKLAQDPVEWLIPKDSLELFRKNKMGLKDFFSSASRL